MKLRDWRLQNEKSRADLAKALQITVETVRRWELPPAAAASSIPDRARMVALYVLTSGQVMPNDFYHLPPLTEAEAESAAPAKSAKRRAS